MPKRAKELGAAEVRRLNKPGLNPVGGVAGLYLQVAESGARSWILRVTVGSKRRDIGLGGYPDVPLAQAREKAREMREQIREGVDPVLQRKAARDALIAAQAKVITFDEAARRFIKAKAQEFRNPKHTAQWETTLQAYASPVIGRLPVDAVTLPHIVQILEPIWTEKTETATRLRGRIESVLSWATVSGFRSGDNPARWRGNLDAVLPKPGKLRQVQHFRALPWAEAPAFMAALREREGVGSRALEFLILTAGRSGEVRGATWEEIDLEARTWTVPAERMKAQREHVVPLCPDAVKLLKALPRFEDCPYVFPSPRGKQLSDATLSKVMKLMGVEGTPHGFRSTFRDWCAEHTNYPREVAEKALAHTIPNAVERAYRRGDLLTKRTRLMQEWARYLKSPAKAGEVVSIQNKSA
ncbi:integrase [Thiohalobacter thiocyanaticus]|uniref:Integrase n=1 Tax=Thiohalobacter thiocyanaticus TaxID=585455 RepID=A0A1Z4VRN4_9GAMM|nr:site-specific integrase [Thiohalobacter thiocyanaticus]BAZ94290.1 integrase [Thiohalobacter thiocyanaticus]